MFIEKQKAGKHIKYYLAHSFRDGAEVVKVRRYLGKDINENELGQRREKAEKAILEQIKNFREIRDPLRFNLSNEEIEGIKKLSHKKDFKIFHLNEKQWTRFSELFSYNTNAIEGSTLTLRDVTNVLEHHKEPDKSKPDIEEAKGVSEAISFIRNTKEHISIELIKKLHSIVFKNSKHFAGKLREKGIEVVIRDGVGNIVNRGAPSEKIMVLLAEFTADSDEKAMDKAKQAQESLGEFNIHSKISSSAADAQKYWIIRRQSFNLLRKHAGVLSTAPFIDDFIVRPDVLPEFLPKLYSILDQYKLTYTIAGHVGDGNFHIIPLMNLHEEKAHKIIEELSVKVYELVHQFGGSITGEHNDGIIRTPFVKMQYGQEVYALFEETKKIWDPKGIFNPIGKGPYHFAYL